jgi:plasmid stabilization system protein ParE
VTHKVLVAPQAEAQIRTIDTWWQRHRPDSPRLFVEDLAEALATLEVAPGVGTRYSHPTLKGLRRLPLRSTRHHVYYLAGSQLVIVLAVWGATKELGPEI